MKRVNVIKEVNCSKTHRRKSIKKCYDCEYFKGEISGKVLCGYKEKSLEERAYDFGFKLGNWTNRKDKILEYFREGLYEVR